MNSNPDPLRLRICGEDLCDSFERLRELHELLGTVLTAKEEALGSVELKALATARDREEDLLHRVVEEEKQRLLITEEIGDLIGHAKPASIRVIEMLEHLPDEVSRRLRGTRDELRTAAGRVGEQNRDQRTLVEHSIGHIQVFLSRLVNQEILGPESETVELHLEELSTDDTTSGEQEAGGEGSSIVMDRLR